MSEDAVVVAGSSALGEGSVQVSLHPLPLLNISEHYTRVRIRSGGDPDVKVIGALIGVQQGREVEITNSFELALSSDGREVNQQFFQDRQGQFKQVFPTFEFLGWYTVGSEPSPLDLQLHTQLLLHNESPLFLQLSPASINNARPGAASGHNLPIEIYESVVDIIGGESVHRFVKIASEEGGYRIETGEAERIAVESASRQAVANASGSRAGQESTESVLIAGLSTQRNAIYMLHTRIGVILQYLDAVRKGQVAPDHETLRQVSSLVSSISASSPEAIIDGREAGLAGEMARETDDVLLTSILGQLTRNLEMTNTLVDKFAIQQSRDSAGSMIFRGDEGLAMGGRSKATAGRSRHGGSR